MRRLVLPFTLAAALSLTACPPHHPGVDVKNPGVCDMNESAVKAAKDGGYTDPEAYDLVYSGKKKRWTVKLVGKKGGSRYKLVVYVDPKDASATLKKAKRLPG